MADHGKIVAEWEAFVGMSWSEFWENLPGSWQFILTNRDLRSSRVSPASILRCRRITGDYEFVTFHPIRFLPAVDEALLWQDNGMDLGPLTRSRPGRPRRWKLLQIGGPGHVSLEDLRGTPIRHLVLTNVSVGGTEVLTEIPGLDMMTLDVRTRSGTFTLPPLPILARLVLHSGVAVDDVSVRNKPQLRIVRADTLYCSFFTPDDV